MAVMIKDMEMPKSCTDCELTYCDRYDNCEYCDITCNNVDYHAMHNLKADDCPLVEIEEPKTGHWIKYGIPRCGEQHYKCTNCEEYFNFGLYSDYYKKAFKFCPNCGAKMISEVEK